MSNSDDQQEKHFIILLDEMAEQDLIQRPLPDIIVPKDQGLYTTMKRLEGEFEFKFTTLLFIKHENGTVS